MPDPTPVDPVLQAVTEALLEWHWALLTGGPSKPSAAAEDITRAARHAIAQQIEAEGRREVARLAVHSADADDFWWLDGYKSALSDAKRLAGGDIETITPAAVRTARGDTP